MYHILCVSRYWSIFSFYRKPTWLCFSLIHVSFRFIILILIIFLNSRVVYERIFHIYVLQYWFMLNALRVTDTLNLSIFYLSIIFLRILLTTYFHLCYLELQGGQVVYQETSCIWILFHTTIGDHHLWLPLLLMTYIVSI